MFDSCLHYSMLPPLTALISLRTLLTAGSYLISNHLN
jgi:hypothetical protein